MGNGAGTIVRANDYAPPEVGPSLQHSGKTSAHSTSGSSTSTSTSSVDVPKITTELVALCESSWRLITKSKSSPANPDSPNNKIAGFGLFCHIFFECMTSFDSDNDIVDKFEPRSSSALISREALLYRVIKYVVSVPSDSFKVKAKLRALGRAHSYRGIGQKQFAVFSASMIKALAIQLKGAATNEIMGAWTNLLDFVVSQLTFDKVVLVKHHTIEAIPFNSGKEKDIGEHSEKSVLDIKTSDKKLGYEADTNATFEGLTHFTRLNSFGSSTDQSSRDVSFNFLADAATVNPDVVQANYMAPIPENIKEKDSSGSGSIHSNSSHSSTSGHSRVANASSNDEDSVSAVVGASEVSFSMNMPTITSVGASPASSAKSSANNSRKSTDQDNNINNTNNTNVNHSVGQQ